MPGMAAAPSAGADAGVADPAAPAAGAPGTAGALAGVPGIVGSAASVAGTPGTAAVPAEAWPRSWWKPPLCSWPAEAVAAAGGT
jgi:hypothetical protein